MPGARGAGTHDDWWAWSENVGAGSTPSVWLRWPALVVCERENLRLYVASDDAGDLRQCAAVSLGRYQPALQLSSGRGAQVVQCVDFRRDCLACGTSAGALLAFSLDAASLDIASAPLEMAGHSKVVTSVSASADGRHLFSASMDRTLRIWTLPCGSPLRTLKIGTPIVAMALCPPPPGAAPAAAALDSPDAAPAPQQLLVGCADGTVRLWDAECAKPSRAARALRSAHAQYVGVIRVAAEYALSSSRDGELQLWRRDAREGYAPWAEGMPRAADLAACWLLDLLPDGIVAVGAAGTVKLWPWSSASPVLLRDQPHASRYLDAPCESRCDAHADGSAAIAFVGVRAHVSASTAGTATEPRGGAALIELCRMPRTSGPMSTRYAGSSAAHPAAHSRAGPAAAAGADTAEVLLHRWAEMAAEEGVQVDSTLQEQLERMQGIASAAGRELSEASVRAFLRRRTQR